MGSNKVPMTLPMEPRIEKAGSSTHTLFDKKVGCRLWLGPADGGALNATVGDEVTPSHMQHASYTVLPPFNKSISSPSATHNRLGSTFTSAQVYTCEPRSRSTIAVTAKFSSSIHAEGDSDTVGLVDKSKDGETLGLEDGFKLPVTVGLEEGDLDGDTLGLEDGFKLPVTVGPEEGLVEGNSLINTDG